MTPPATQTVVKTNPAAAVAVTKCLACGFGNKPGDLACAACGSSLHLKLCTSCEAINASRAEQCHACGAAFAKPQEKKALAGLAPAVAKPAPRRRQLVALILLPLVATLVLAYYVYRGSFWAEEARHAIAPAAPKAPPAPQPASAPAPQKAPVAAEAPAEPKVARPIVAPAKSIATESAPPPAPTSRITHTKRQAPESVVITAPVVTAPPAPAVVKSAVRPVGAPKPISETCTDPVAALGLCTKQGGQ